MPDPGAIKDVPPATPEPREPADLDGDEKPEHQVHASEAEEFKEAHGRYPRSMAELTQFRMQKGKPAEKVPADEKGGDSMIKEGMMDAYMKQKQRPPRTYQEIRDFQREAFFRGDD